MLKVSGTLIQCFYRLYVAHKLIAYVFTTHSLLQLIADPVLVPLVCVPFLLVRGIPVIQSLRICLLQHGTNITTTDLAASTSAIHVRPCHQSGPLLWDFTDLNYDQLTLYHRDLVSGF